MTSASNSTNRLLEVLNGFSDRKPRKRNRAEALDHFVATASTVLDTSSTPASTFSGKRVKALPANGDKDSTDQKDTHKTKLSLSDEDLLFGKADLQYHHQCLEKEIQELKQIEDTRNDVLQEIIDVWGVYKYGLMRIGALADLSEAPDAIMPGNF